MATLTVNVPVGGSQTAGGFDFSIPGYAWVSQTPVGGWFLDKWSITVQVTAPDGKFLGSAELIAETQINNTTRPFLWDFERITTGELPLQAPNHHLLGTGVVFNHDTLVPTTVWVEFTYPEPEPMKTPQEPETAAQTWTIEEEPPPSPYDHGIEPVPVVEVTSAEYPVVLVSESEAALARGATVVLPSDARGEGQFSPRGNDTPEATTGSVPPEPVPTWVWLAGGLGVAYMLLRR